MHRRLEGLAARAASYVAVAALAIAIYARARPPTTRLLPAPDTPFAWIAPWFAAPVITVTEHEIVYRGQLISTVAAALRDDAPTFRIEALASRLRSTNLDASPHARRQRAHAAMCTAAELVHIDRRILCAGRFVVIELVHSTDRRLLVKLLNTVESTGAYAVMTLRAPS